ncbi:hypothetical protein EDB81DRAFT_914172 [Dactylonectria macrodidyma]|uniref:DUF7514 domain-containing protein n=1 Tax=Dactylonectria macrodidyma TaxID=307937 RepID=A0A9P9DJA8_9HYPO|nr:hypothetical protein EDB81DRAFT_914172 [Dactylonectria macrodidyma]
MSLRDAYRTLRDACQQARDSSQRARSTAYPQSSGTWPAGPGHYWAAGMEQHYNPCPQNAPQSPDYQSAGAGRQSGRSFPSSSSTPPSGAPQNPQAGAALSHSAGFWSDLVIPTYAPSPRAERWQASPSLELLVDVVYRWAEAAVAPCNEGGLSPQKVGMLLSMGEYADEHNICSALPDAMCEQGASRISFGNRWMKENLINQYMMRFYDLYGLSYNLPTVTPQPRSFFDSLSCSLATPRPLLTREGHLRFLLIGILVDPDTNFVNINKLLSKMPPLRHPQTGGTLPPSIPRRAFPATEDPAMKQYVEGIKQQMATMALTGAAANLQQGYNALGIAGGMHGHVPQPPSALQQMQQGSGDGYAGQGGQASIMNMYSNANLQQSQAALGLAGSLHGGGPGFTPTGTGIQYGGGWIGAGI